MSSQSSLLLHREDKRESVETLVGKPLRRKEDPRFLLGRSSYVDDMKLPGMLYGFVVRSPYGHARINRIDVDKAQSHPEVHLILTAKILSIKNAMPVPQANDSTKYVPRPLLAEVTTTYQGEPVAYIVADTRQAAEDASELVEVEYAPLPVVIDASKGLDPNCPKVHDEIVDNIATHIKRSSGDLDKFFNHEAEKIITIDQTNQRVAPVPMEPRAIIADFDPGRGHLTVWMGTQGPFQTRILLADVLGLQENKVRVVAPDVGGAFGAKFSLYAEEVLTSLASTKLCRPVKWIETRSENFSSMYCGRGQHQHVEAAVKNDGTILGIRANIIVDLGSYVTDEAILDQQVTLDMIPSLYNLRCYEAESFGVLTNKVPFDAYRGAGKPEANYLVERIVDRAATELGLDPAEVRLKNFIPTELFPFKSLSGVVYDTGNYSRNLNKALKEINYNKWRLEERRRNSSKQNTHLLGIGISCYVDWSSWAPDFPQTAAVTVSQSGKISIISGAAQHGQGHETPLSQIVADELGVSVDDIDVTYGDTSTLPFGTVIGGSRSSALSGTAVLLCARKIKGKMAEIGAHILGVDPSSVSFVKSKLISSQSVKSITFSEVAKSSYTPSKIPSGMEPTLHAYSAFAPKNFTFPFGSHIAVVDVDGETGMVRLLDYVAVDDCGKLLNPMIVEGQAHGGIVQGIGQALLEEVIYDEAGQLLTSSFLDYQIPLAEDLPSIRWFRTETPSPENPLGVKGVGENGISASPPAIVNAIEDALTNSSHKIEAMPLTPERVLGLLTKTIASPR